MSGMGVYFVQTLDLIYFGHFLESVSNLKWIILLIEAISSEG